MTNQRPSAEPVWGIREIRESSDELLEMLEKKDLYLPTLQQMISENRKREWLSVRVLLKTLLNEEKEIHYTNTGKPFLSDNSYYISVTHTKGYVAVILDKEYPVGIDIEYISPRIRKIRSRFMSVIEEANISNEMEIIHLLLHWSAKESMFKALGEENVEFQEHLHIEAFKPRVDILSTFEAYEVRTEHRHNFLIYYLANKHYLVSFCRMIPKSK